MIVNEGIDTATGNHTMIFSIKAAIARDQWERHQANWKRAKHNAWERGIYTSRAPVGYAANGGRRLLPDQYAPVVRRAYELRASGASWTAVAATLTDAGVQSAFGNTNWGVGTTTQAFMNPIYKGVLRCGCGCGQEVRVPELAIVGPTLWQQVQPRKTGKGGRPPGGGAHLLSGMLRCGACGFLLQVSSTIRKGKKYRYYRCSNLGKGRCPDKAIVAGRPAEEYVIQAALERTGYRIEEPGG